jgi:hypothetical protein
MVKKTQGNSKKLQVTAENNEDNVSRTSSSTVHNRKKTSVIEELFKLVGKSATIIIVISFCYWGFFLYKTLLSPMLSSSSPAIEVDPVIKVMSLF